jgi:hypothetical protein
MKVYVETPLVDYVCSNYKFGAKKNIERLTIGELEEIEEKITELYPNGISDGDLYDLFDEKFDVTCSWICNEAEAVQSREPIRYQVRDEEIDTYYGSEDVDEKGFTIYEINDIWGEGNGRFWDGAIGEYQTLEDVLLEDFEEI